MIGPIPDKVQADQYARIKVEFQWKNKKLHSCWLRSLQAWGGDGFGTQFIPRIGQKVLISFLDGNPDNPIVIGGSVRE